MNMVIGTLELPVDIINGLVRSNKPQMKKRIKKIGLLLAKIWSQSFWIGPGGPPTPRRGCRGGKI